MKKLLSLLFTLAVLLPTEASAFHGCEDNEGSCDNSPTVYICIQEGSCKFEEPK